MKTHKTYKITLALLAAMLAVIGTTATVVHADGPETPPEAAPVVEQNIDSYLDQASRDLVNEMNPTFQAFVAEAWVFVKGIAPAGDWEEAIRDIIPQIHANAEDQGGLLGAQGGSSANSNCSISYYTTLGSSGWAAAVTSSSCTMNFLTAKVGVNSHGDTGSCFNCRSVSAYINGLSCGWYFAYGNHEWGNSPSGSGASSDSGQAGC